MRELSVFCDESGDFGAVTRHSPVYIVGLVFHEQASPIDPQVAAFSSSVAAHEMSDLIPVHTAPLIRREERYRLVDGQRRKKLFDISFTFFRRCDVTHFEIVVEKRHFGIGSELESRIAKELGALLRDNSAFFHSFDRVVVYYDRGQKEISRTLQIIFSAALANVEFRTVEPADYLLFQVADLACTMTLVEHRRNSEGLSKSENAFFGGAGRFKKTYMKPFRLKAFTGR